MAVDSTLLMREVATVINEGEGIRQHHIRVRIKTPEMWLDPVRTLLVSLERDYEDGYGDVMVIETTLGYGDYAYKLYPHHDELFVDLTVQPKYIGANSEGKDTRFKTRRYRAILMEQDNPGMTDRSPQASSREDLNATRTKNVQLQLIDEGLFQIRLASVGRLYRQATPMAVLQSLLTETTTLVDSSNQQRIFGVDWVPGFNTKVRQHILLPHGLPLTEAPRFLQNEAGGIYGAGLGCYLQDGYWRVFPTYDTTRWKKTPKALTILNVPPNRYRGGERTYRRTANQVVIVASGHLAVNDEGLFHQLNEGNALRFTQVENLLDFGKTENNRTLIQRNQNVYEVQGVALQAGLTHARWSRERATSNPFRQYTDIARRNGRYAAVQWDHGDASLLYPGMPVKFLAAVDNKLATFYGVLLGVHEQRVPKEGGLGVSDYVGSVMLKVFLDRLEAPV